MPARGRCTGRRRRVPRCSAAARTSGRSPRQPRLGLLGRLVCRRIAANDRGLGARASRRRWRRSRRSALSRSRVGRTRSRNIGAHARARAASFVELRIVLRREPAREPASSTVIAYDSLNAESLLDVDDLVRELVEDEPRDLGLGPAHERRQHRIVELAERRIRRHAADVDVVARGREPPASARACASRK